MTITLSVHISALQAFDQNDHHTVRSHLGSSFRYTLDEYSTARRGAVVRGFIDALTRGRPVPGTPPTTPLSEEPPDIGRTHGGPRPIELHAHDPQRYIGDMLAWLHQASASEKETLTQLLSECDKRK